MATEKEQRNNQLLTSILELIGFLLHSIVLIISALYKACLPSSYQYKKILEGEITLVTGGGGGLGRLLALRLSRLGAVVVLWDINEKGIEETVNLVKGVGGKAYGYKCNIADRKNVYEVAKKTQDEVGDVSVLINNAGVVSGYSLLDTPDDLIQRTFDVNIVAHFWTVKAFLPKMIERDSGHIVTIASLAGHIGVSKLVDYCASKYAAVGFDESLKSELFEMGVEGVKTTVVCPYFIQQTGMFENVSSKFFPTLKSNDVADRIIDALRKEEDLVIIPGYMRWFLPLKLLIPRSVLNLFTKTMLPDASPHHPSTPIVQLKNSRSAGLHKSEMNNTLSDSIKQTHPSLTTKGKDL
ncbi:estradiol 17-beta-dehydrogenase 11-like [Diorhabda carinulata]|uniref:estradiol 17-beta-dehydrogenase 11-like n=1 Tax=Diorhabda carinulata TaxID=1163345 RepID=UPI0025A087DC|nr:estradiol 17-beta-dehydrogenase 11-like [Diorhabda carinulata]XP_057655950.1 estradiol 17-beta-dehydrogenase 11-like [Diorhabda carinulata]XP_057655951.1 estradiol 17-beta-dehydrogenase 11-like [Diorhabda carinulata]